jgi:hypothetical protein
MQTLVDGCIFPHHLSTAEHGIAMFQKSFKPDRQFMKQKKNLMKEHCSTHSVEKRNIRTIKAMIFDPKKRS